MKYITFYTTGYYESVYNNILRASASDVGLDVRAYREHNYQDWARNTRTKANVVKRALVEYGDIVWLDADTSLKSYPILFEQIPEEYDVAMYFLDWERHWHGVEGCEKRELVNAVMMLRNRPQVRELVNHWIDSNINSKVCDQPILEELLLKRNDINVYRLPDQYCAIIDYSGVVPDYIKDPVIVQTQASREVKRNKSLLNL